MRVEEGRGVVMRGEASEGRGGLRRGEANGGRGGARRVRSEEGRGRARRMISTRSYIPASPFKAKTKFCQRELRPVGLMREAGATELGRRSRCRLSLTASRASPQGPCLNH